MFYQKNVHQQVSVLNKILINISLNFVPSKLITCDDRDPPWMKEVVKIEWKKQNLQRFYQK